MTVSLQDKCLNELFHFHHTWESLTSNKKFCFSYEFMLPLSLFFFKPSYQLVKFQPFIPRHLGTAGGRPILLPSTPPTAGQSQKPSQNSSASQQDQESPSQSCRDGESILSEKNVRFPNIFPGKLPNVSTVTENLLRGNIKTSVKYLLFP